VRTNYLEPEYWSEDAIKEWNARPGNAELRKNYDSEF